MAIDAIELTRRLVNIQSTTYHEEAVGEFLAAFLAVEGWAVERMPVDKPAAGTPGAEGGGERFNLYAQMAEVTPDVVFSTHMDTVPPFFELREDDEFLYGRGTCDAKGIIAAQVAAAERLRDEGVKVGMLFVVGEERDSAGAKVANLLPRGSRFLINGEPTDNRLALASKGCLRVEIFAEGKMAHSAYPELGESAIDKLVAALADIARLELPVVEGIGDSTLNVGIISRRARAERHRRQSRGSPSCAAGGSRRAHQGGAPGRSRRPGAGGVLARTALRADAPGRQTADHGGKVHNGYSKPDRLGRAVSTRAGQHPCRAYAL